MGRGVVYCDVCGERLLETAFEQGKAMESGGRMYCIDCAKQKGLSASATKASTPRIAAVRAPKRGKHSTRRLNAYTPQPGPAVKPRNNLPLIVGGSLGVLAVILLVAISSGGGEKKTPPKENGPIARPDPKPPVEDPNKKKDEELRKKYGDLEKFADDNKGEPREVLDRCHTEKHAFRGSTWAPKVQTLIDTAQARLDYDGAVKNIKMFLAKAEGMWQGDENFGLRDEVERTFKSAMDLATRYAKDNITRVEQEQRRFKKAMEERATKLGTELLVRAEKLMGEKKLEEAETTLDEFPDSLLDTKKGTEVAAMRKRVEDALNAESNRPTIQQEFRVANQLMSRQRRYAEAAVAYEKVMKELDNKERVRREGLGESQVKRMKQIGYWHIAAAWGIAKKKATEICPVLEKALQAEFDVLGHLNHGDTCTLKRDFNRVFEHIKDEPQFKRLLEKYKPEKEAEDR